MGAEDFGAFGWLFHLWAEMVLTLLAVTEPVLTSISDSSRLLIGAAAFLWLILVLLRISDVGLIRGVVGGVLIFAVILIGMQPATFASPGRAPIQLLEIQATPLALLLGVHHVYSAGLGAVLDEHTDAAGKILPAQRAVDDAIERSAALFEGSDLAELIRDYNASCAPPAAHNATPVELGAYHAVGLLGGGGLGIPDEALGQMAQLKTVASSFWDRLAGMFSPDTGMLDRGHQALGLGILASANQAWDLGTLRERRAAGIEMLRSHPVRSSVIGRAPLHGYRIPTADYWEGVFTGNPQTKPDYLRYRDVEHPISSNEVNPEAAAVFRPSGCVELYHLAQAGAEQAYRALERVGGTSAVTVAGMNSGSISAAAAWQRFLGRAFNGTGEVATGGDATAAGIMAGVQLGKNWASWLELQTLLPGYVVGLAGLFWMALLIAPVVLLIAPVRGIQPLLAWLSLLAFPVVCLVFVHAIAVAASLALAGISMNQAATASGWAGRGADYDALRGALGMVGAIMLAASTWFASQLTGVNISGLAGSARGAVATTTDAAAAVGKIADGAVMVGRLARLGKTVGGSLGGGGPGGGSAPSGGAPGGRGGGPSMPPTQPLASVQAAGMRGPGVAAASRAAAAGISLVPPKQAQSGHTARMPRRGQE